MGAGHMHAWRALDYRDDRLRSERGSEACVGLAFDPDLQARGVPVIVAVQACAIGVRALIQRV
eukprot:6778195-Prymnesium_polylepis.1